MGLVRPEVDFLYSLYDALVSIDVPADKARAVVNAMERDMSDRLATKADLAVLEERFEMRFDAVEKSLKQEIEHFRAQMRSEFDSSTSGLRKDMELMKLAMTVRLGSLQIVGLGLLFAALKLT